MSVVRLSICAVLSQLNLTQTHGLGPQITAWRKSYPVRQEPQLPDHRRRSLRSIWKIWKHTADSDRKRAEDKGHGVCCVRRRDGREHRFVKHSIVLTQRRLPVTGQERIGALEWLPFAGTIYRCFVSYAGQARRRRGKS